MADLEERWRALCGRLNLAADLNQLDWLRGVHKVPPRAYHNLDHVLACLTEFDHARHLAEEPDAIEVALWFHDAVYNPRYAENEEASAIMAKGWLDDSGAPAELGMTVADLIFKTKHDPSDAPETIDQQLIVDVDLSILGQPAEAFDEYENKIRDEYDWVNWEVYRIRRPEILGRFLKRERIYFTEEFHDRYEAAARSNLERSINCFKEST